VVGPLKDVENQLMPDIDVMCETFNEYCLSVFTSENDSNGLQEVRNIFVKDIGSRIKAY